VNDSSQPCAPRETVRADVGAWISGPGVVTKPASAAELEPGDVLILDSATIATVTHVSHGLYWLRTGHEDGVAIDWKHVSGNASGTLFRALGDTLERVTAMDDGAS
jgi:hypothetical protein